MNTIQTAEEFLLSKQIASGNEDDKEIAFFELTFNRKGVLTKMIEFAKLHTQAALEAAANNVKLIDFAVVDADSILNAYNLENIK